MKPQRGASLIETLIVVALISAVTFTLTALRGTALPQTHVAALGLQAALAEARSLAMSNASAGGSGATLSVSPTGKQTLVSVYGSRPIEGSEPPTADTGFPALRYPVAMTLAGKTSPGEPFTIFISSSGDASIAAGYAYDPARPVMLAADPGCDEINGVAITITDGVHAETHPLDCRQTQYEVVSSPPPGAS